MARFFAWVPVQWGPRENTFKVELEAADNPTGEALEALRRTAKEFVTSRGMKVLEGPGYEVKITRKP
ncbi:hypothetical protein [Streptomyces sp. NPDC046832]|uniref:hypothetical protein n=1 Tax=Streptomyces sp. NPDC046832 TaxID=3155020 RepID=UPI0033C53278